MPRESVGMADNIPKCVACARVEEYIGMDLPILYEDDLIVAVDKPSGVMTHPDGHTLNGTVSDWFGEHYPDSKGVGETQKLKDGSEIMRPGIVHRLDRDTSGVMILCKTPESHAFFKKAFQEHVIRKTYLAFVYGTPKEPKGTITFAIGRSRKDFRLRSAQPKAKGQMREAITQYSTVGSIGTHTLLKVMPETGRTHQIRVHLKAIHHPVVCDALYAPNHPCDLGFTRLGLHAAQLEIHLPDNSAVVINSPVPPELQAAYKRFVP